MLSAANLAAAESIDAWGCIYYISASRFHRWVKVPACDDGGMGHASLHVGAALQLCAGGAEV